ncbi:MAG TPA: TonB-dependent receptor, partial [Methylomirabilota bacterium]|nr:TonB-dependent receptor [Methylomirabilota bacterium]
DIRTFDGREFQGVEGTVRAGAGERFYAAEFKTGHQWSDNAHLLLYGGVTHRRGADADVAPIIPGISGESFHGGIDGSTGLPVNGRPVRAGEEAPYDIDDKIDYRGLPPLKFHAELTVGNLDVWARYTRGGEVQDWDHRALATHGFPWMTSTNGPGWWWMPFAFGFTNPVATLTRQAVGYQQASAGLDHVEHFNADWEGALRLGFDMTDYERFQMFNPNLLDAHREDKLNVRYLLTYSGSDRHLPTFGFEYQHATFGLDSPGFPHGGAWQGGNPMEDWSTDTWSLLGEDRWEINTRWMLFAGARVDKNDYTDFMFSPRLALVYTPTERDTFKLILSQAAKANFAEELRRDHVTLGTDGDTERLRAIEAGYGRQFGQNWSVGVNSYFHDYKVIGYDNRSTLVGRENTVGVEGELAYQSPSFRLGFSHGFTTLLNFYDGSPGQAITAEPYGYGSDLNHWSAHITKLHATWRPVDKLRLSGSLRVFWGFPGSDDFRRYSNDAYYNGTASGVQETFATDPAGYNPYDQIQLRLNLGLSYDLTKHLTLGLHGYNLLGLIDGDFNNRLFVYSAQARREAPGGALTLTAKF